MIGPDHPSYEIYRRKALTDPRFAKLIGHVPDARDVAPLPPRAVLPPGSTPGGCGGCGKNGPLRVR